MIAPEDSNIEDETDESGQDSTSQGLTRSEQTRAARAVNKLGVQLTKLSPSVLDRLDLPERVRQAIAVSQGMPPRSRGRQNRLIAQLLRAEDHAAIRARVESHGWSRRADAHPEEPSERWVVRLVEEGDPAVEALVAEYPLADRQQLRTLTRSARRDPAASRAKRARRELLRAIRALSASEGE